MSVVVVGCNHRTADLPLLERLAVPSDDTAKALRSLTALEHVMEAVVLSTCNRVEVYAHLSRFHPGLQELRGWFADRGAIPVEEFDDLHYAHYDELAAAHLFEVAGGLDSMVVGEQQIAVQVKQAMEAARLEGTARRVLQRLFRQAVSTGRRIRRETDITSGASSMVDIGLELVAGSLDTGSLRGQRVLIVGAGKIGSLTAKRLVDEQAQLSVWNRNPDKADRLADRSGGEVVETGGLAQAVGEADVVVCTTGAGRPIVDVDVIADAMNGRTEPVVFLDLAMPRNVDPAAASIEGVSIIDIDSVRVASERELTGPVLQEAGEIVQEEVARFVAWTRAIEVDPTIAALRERAEDVRRGEYERLGSRLASLDERDRETVDALTRGILNTLLHDPTMRLKNLANAGGAEHYANALRELFDLDE
ncbi:MAG: glutamyl-tRNA reductase [Nitriliruptorales bacterium]|nr:glutamyl-tRNA reductase [Nitriliruptorales bacterium]